MIFYLDMRVMPHYSARYKDHLGGYCCYLLSQVTHSADCVWVGCHYYYRASVISVICIMNQIGTIYQIFVSKLQNPTSYYLGQVIRVQLKKKKIWNFPELVGGWVWKSPFSRFKKIKKYALKMHKNA